MGFVNCTPKVRQKNLTWGVFIMKLTYEDRVQIHELRKQGQTFNQLSKRGSLSTIVGDEKLTS